MHRSSAPWCLLAGVRAFAKGDAYAQVVEGTVNGDLDAFADGIIEKRPDAVSFCCYIWNVTETLYVCKRVKAALGCVTVLGGPEVAYRADDVLSRYGYVDYVLAGEGEYCFFQFTDMLCGLRKNTQVDGLSFRERGKVVSNPVGVYTGTPPSPFCDEYFETLGGRIRYIESSRGCPYRCSFCLSGRLSGFRVFDLDAVKHDMLRLANCGRGTVKFVDRTFNANERHANEILSFIADNYGGAIPRGVCFHFEIAGDILKESTLGILEKMPRGAVQLEIGMQSFNEKTLAAVNRRTDTAVLVKNIKRLVSFGNMHIHIDLIAGLSFEDMQSFEKSFDIGFSLGAHMLQLGFLKLLYGAPMRERAAEFPCTFSDTAPYEVISTPWLSEDELRSLKNCEDAVERMYNSGRFLLTVRYLTEKVGLTPFSLFYQLGNAVDGTGMSLGEYAAAVYGYFRDKCDGGLLRETIVCDLLCCSSALQIPPELRINDKRHKRAKALFSKTTKVAVLPHSGKIFAVDHGGERDLFGRFPSREYNINIVE